MPTQKLYAGVKLREIRARLSLTQKAFADKLASRCPI
jgi:XRE family transcriptional regulator, fatty acid utilization regulator